MTTRDVASLVVIEGYLYATIDGIFAGIQEICKYVYQQSGNNITNFTQFGIKLPWQSYYNVWEP